MNRVRIYQLFIKFSKNQMTLILSIENAVKQLSEFLESALTSWQTYISDLRDSYMSLNYFSINQLKFINSNICKILSDNKQTSVLKLIESMLFNLCPNVGINQLKEAFNKTLKSVQDIKIQTNEDDDNLALAWKEFIQNENILVDKIKKPFLGLTQSALLLEALSIDYRDSNPCAGRKIPGYLKHNRGVPSLIVCEKREQIPVVLSIYAFDVNAPMPNNDELLYCDRNTSYEDMEIFMRRVLTSDDQKIYTILNIQDLSYDTSNRLENFLKIYQKKLETKQKRFILAFICCVEQQAESIIASLFLKNKVNAIKLPDTLLIEYVRNNLQNLSGLFSPFEKYINFCLISQTLITISQKEYSNF